MNKDNDILMKVLELVKMVEREKINIGNNTKINLSFVFKEIDIDEDGEISGEDLYKYAQKEKMLYSKKECEYFIRFYDKDYSGGLAFEEFMSVFLSLYHNKLNQYMSNNIFLSKENDVKDKEEDYLQKCIVLLFGNYLVIEHKQYFRLKHMGERYPSPFSHLTDVDDLGFTVLITEADERSGYRVGNTYFFNHATNLTFLFLD